MRKRDCMIIITGRMTHVQMVISSLTRWDLLVTPILIDTSGGIQSTKSIQLAFMKKMSIIT